MKKKRNIEPPEQQEQQTGRKSERQKKKRAEERNFFGRELTVQEKAEKLKLQRIEKLRQPIKKQQEPRTTQENIQQEERRIEQINQLRNQLNQPQEENLRWNNQKKLLEKLQDQEKLEQTRLALKLTKKTQQRGMSLEETEKQILEKFAFYQEIRNRRDALLDINYVTSQRDRDTTNFILQTFKLPGENKNEYTQIDTPISKKGFEKIRENDLVSDLLTLIDEKLIYMDLTQTRTVQEIFDSYQTVADVFLEWEEGIVPSQLFNDGEYYQPMQSASEYLVFEGVAVSGSDRIRQQYQFTNSFAKNQTLEERVRLNNLFEILQGQETWKQLTEQIIDQSIKNYSFDLRSGVWFRYQRLLAENNITPTEEYEEGMIDLPEPLIWAEKLLQQPILNLGDIMRKIGIDVGSFYRIITFLIILSHYKDYNWSRFLTANWDGRKVSYKINERYQRDNDVFIENQQRIDLFNISPFLISGIIIYSYARYKSDNKKNLNLIRWHTQSIQENQANLISLYKEKRNYSRQELTKYMDLGIEKNEEQVEFRYQAEEAVLVTGNIANIGHFVRVDNNNEIWHRQANANAIANLIVEKLNYLLQKIDDVENCRIRIDFKVYIRDFNKSNNEIQTIIRQKEAQLRDNGNQQEFGVADRNALKEIRYQCGFGLDRDDYQRKLANFGESEKDFILALMYKSMGFQELGFRDEDLYENVEITESGLSQEAMEDFLSLANLKTKKLKGRQTLITDYFDKAYKQERQFIRDLIQEFSTQCSLAIERVSVVVAEKIENINALIQRRVGKQLNDRNINARQANALNQVDIIKIQQLNFQDRGQLPNEIKKFVHYQYRQIEIIYGDFICSQHVWIFLLQKCGEIDEDCSDESVKQYENFFNSLAAFNAVGDQQAGLRFLINKCLQLNIMRSSSYEEVIKVYDINSLTQGPSQLLPPLKFKEKPDFVLLIVRNHLTIIYEENIQEVLQYFLDNKFYIDQQEKYLKNIKDLRESKLRDYNQGLPYKKFKKKKNQEQQKVDYSPEDLMNERKKYQQISNVQELQSYYINYVGDKTNLQGKNQIFLFYDIETTTSRHIRLGHSHKMSPYLLCWKIFIPNEGKEFGKFKNGSKGYFEGKYTIQRFILFIEELMMIDDNRKIIISAWNGRKFDCQFLLEKFFQYFPFDTELIGTVTNPKYLGVNKKIEFWDAMDMVSPMSLQAFCNAMNKKGKLDGKAMFNIQQLEDWEKASPEQKKILIDYCEQDVECMVESIIEFNKLFLEILQEFRGPSIEIKGEPFILCKTMAKFSYTFFCGKLLPGSIAPTPVDNYQINEALVQSYRGGFVQSFIFGTHSVGKDKVKFIQYIDVNSLYPSVMAYTNIPLMMGDQIKIYNNKKIDANFLYSMIQFDLGDEGVFGFFGVKVFQNNRFTKVIYPRRWEANENQKCLWMWGTEILCAQSCLKNLKIQISHYIESLDRGALFRPIEFMYNKRLAIKKEKPQLANAYKIKMNSLYGRFGMKAYEINCIIPQKTYSYLSQQEQDLVFKNTLLKSLKNVTEQSGQIKILKNSEIKMQDENNKLIKYKLMNEYSYLPKNQAQRLKFIASYIANQSRCRLLATIYQIHQETNLKVLYCDTDSVVFSGQELSDLETLKNLTPRRWSDEHKSCEAATKFGDGLGEMKEEIDMSKELLISFQAFGPKFYRYKLMDLKTNKTEWIFKSKGINQNLKTLEDEDLNKVLNKRRQEKFFEDFEQQLSANVYQVQIRSKQGLMLVQPLLKQNKYRFTRKLLVNQRNEEIYNDTVPFDDIDDYLNYKEKVVINNGKKFVYREEDQLLEELYQ